MKTRHDVSQLESHLGYWFRFVSNHVSYGFKQKVEAKGVTVAEWVLMREMLALGKANPSQLAERLGMTRGAVSKLVDRLLQKELVERALFDGDHRFQIVSLTSFGKKLVPILARLADENDQEFFGHIDAKQQLELMTVMKEIVRRHAWKKLPVD